MTENNDQINQLLNKLETLRSKQEMFSAQINEIRSEIYKLKTVGEQITKAVQPEKEIQKIIRENQIENVTEKVTSGDTSGEYRSSEKTLGFVSGKTESTPSISLNLEKFIGENLINKIGIVILVIGVAIGVKYSIEHKLISPLTRILLGYVMGLSLLGIGIKLKTNYENYSAVLVSGAMTIMYFMTYAAYNFYQLVPQWLAFVLMVIFTVFTVFASLNYNKQIIAHFGLVGAYAVPSLLSDNSGNVTILYSYMAIINIGILVISFVKYWKPIFYSSFLLTWFMYISWYKSGYQTAEHFGLALTFLTVFFVIFYLTFLAYKLRKKEKFELEDILLLLANSFLFYGIGYSILVHHEVGKQLLGAFTIGNALIHLIVSLVIYKQKLADRNLFYFVSGLVLVFITTAIPVQLDGNWVTLLWAGEAALLFWIGRTKTSPAYEILSYPLMIIAFMSILQDWGNGPYLKQPQADILPILNINFLTSLLFLASFGFITFLSQNKKCDFPAVIKDELKRVISISIPAIFLFTLYMSFRMEIASYFQQLFAHSEITVLANDDYPASQHFNFQLLKFKSVWISNYSVLFLSILSIVNIRKLKNKQLGLVNLGLTALAIAVFLIEDLYLFSELRGVYLKQTLSQFYSIGYIYIGIRYISMGFIAILFLITYKYIRQKFLQKNLRIEFDLLLHSAVLWIASSELISWMDLAESTQSYKLGLSILWGVYALLLISLGIWKKKKHLRIGAITVFAVTLLKLFFYDISYLDTISKTIVFVLLGILLLIISFLYNKYKNVISDEPTPPKLAD